MSRGEKMENYVPAIISGATTTGLFAMIIKFLWEKVNKKQDTEMCIEKNTQIKERMQKGDEKFNQLIAKMDHMNDTLSGNNTAIELLSQRIGQINGQQ